MRAFRDVGAFTGGLALAATLVLTSPGVEIARADEAAAAAHSADEATCQSTTEQGEAEVRAYLAELQRLQNELAASSRRSPGDGEIVVLNNSGYGYGSKTFDLPDLRQFRHER